MRTGRWAAGLACLAGSPCSIAQPSITNLGVLPGHTTSSASGISADGMTVVGTSGTTTASFYFRFSVASGMQALGVQAGNPNGFGAFARTNGDGSVIVGSGTSNRAFKWTALGGVQNLASFPGHSYSVPTGVSLDGQFISGSSGSTGNGNAVRWNPAAPNIQDLGTFPGYFNAYAWGISGDGSVVVGTADEGNIVTDRAFRWTAAGGIQSLTPPLPAGRTGATCVSLDGTVIAGQRVATGGAFRAYRWTAGGYEDLSASAAYSAAAAINGDGSTIVGLARFGSISSPNRAFLWRVGLGFVDLNAYLPTLGIDLTGWVLTWASGVSADGVVIVGNGTHNGLTRAWAVNLDKDRDGDGLLDYWESNGIPYRKGDGTTGHYMLPGADPMRKDIYVEVDAMDGLAPLQSTLDVVGLSFEAAPVSNPSGQNGIKLHAKLDETNIPGQSFGDPWVGLAGVKAARFGRDHADERQNADWAAIRAAKALAYRYGLFAHSFVLGGETGYSGIAEMVVDDPPGVGGNDFMVTLGTWGSRVFDADIQAGTFMHELGHTLGLRHGGADHEGYKPNYVSVMNYTWQTPNCLYASSWRLDYSRHALPMLDRTSLSESSIFGAAYIGRQFPYSVCIAGPTSGIGCAGPVSEFMGGSPCTPSCTWIGFRLGDFGTWVDWDNSNSQTPAPATVCAPVNYFPGSPPGMTELKGHDDWSSLTYNFRLSPFFADGVHPAGMPVPELTLQAHEALSRAAVPTVACYPNCDASTTTPVLNVGDFTCFLQKYAAQDPYANCDGSTTAPTLNVGDFTCFLQSYAAGCR